MSSALPQMLFWIPTILLSIVGIAVAAVYFSRCPTAAALVMVACVLSIVRAIAIPLIQGLGAGNSLEERMQWQTLVTVFSTVTSSATFVLFLVAAFSGRSDSRNSFANQSPYDHSKPVVLAEFAQSDREAFKQ